MTQARREHECVDCGQLRKVAVTWPIGPVCHPCRRRRINSPQRCAACGQLRVLIGVGRHGGICERCSGTTLDYTCRRCGGAGNLHSGASCARCILDERLRRAFGGDGGTVPDRVRPLVATLMSGNHWTLINWLRHSRAAKILIDVATHHEAITHEVLDRFPQDINTAYARELLIAADILTPRNEPVAQLQLWADRTIERLPASLGRIIRPFAEWEVVRDARARAARGPYTQTAAVADRDVIRTAIMFLTWLGEQHTALAYVSQHHLDQWLTANRSRRNQIGPFLRWVNARGLTAVALDVPKRRSGQPTRFLTSDDHLEQLKRCLNDDQLPLDLRIIGALIRLYALPVARIVELTTDRYQREGGHSYLRIKASPVLLPPKLAALIEQAITRVTTMSTLSGIPQVHLFPGQPPSRPRSVAAVQRQLTKHGLPSIRARNTAMLEAVASLPVVVIGDLLGVHPTTAAKWARLAQHNWADYLAARQDGPDQRAYSVSKDRGFGGQ